MIKIESKKPTLILIEGDELSDRILETAKKANFAGNIATFSREEAATGGPFPRLIDGTADYGPSLISAYFN